MVLVYSKLLHQTSFGLAMGGAIPWLWPLFKVLHFAGMALFVGGCVAFQSPAARRRQGAAGRAAAEACPTGARSGSRSPQSPASVSTPASPNQYHELAIFLQDGVRRAGRRERAADHTSGLHHRVDQWKRTRMCRSARSSSPSSLCLWFGVIFIGRMRPIFRDTF